MEMIDTFKNSLSIEFEYDIVSRRPGDLPKYYAGTDKARKLLKWKAESTLLDMCRDSLNWQKHYNKL